MVIKMPSKFLYLQAFFFLLTVSFHFNSSAKEITKDFSFSGYLRAGTGSTNKGGGQECIQNSGASSNEFRLGNECGFYGESTFRVYHLRGQDNLDPYFFTQLTLAFNPAGKKLFENDTNQKDINLVEAYVEAGQIENKPYSYWIGKRFYRENDAHIYDWYYFADMSGVGAGVGKVPLAGGQLHVAHLIQKSNETTTVGTPTLQFIDVRLKEIALGSNQKMMVWTGYGWIPEGKSISQGTRYESGQGHLLGFKHQLSHSLGSNETALIYGYGVMESLNLYNTSTLRSEDAYKNSAERYRLVEVWTYDAGIDWSFQAVAAAEMSDSKARQDSKSYWYSAGIRPLLKLTDHYQIAFELGHSRVYIESEKLGERELSRVTIAPQLSLSRSFWARPVMRAFVSYSTWNDANTSRVTTSAPAFTGLTQAFNIGYQAEVWF